jgi:plastocyanin
MYHDFLCVRRLAVCWVALGILLISLLPSSGAQGAGLAEPTVNTTVELIAVEDQGMIEGAPAFVAGGAPYFVLNGRPNAVNQDWNFIQFDLSAIPANATIVSAQLKLGVIGFGGPARDLEVGRADGDWEEGVTSWSTMPSVTWVGNVQTITDIGEVTWPLRPLVERWHDGSVANNGVVVRTLDNGNNAGAQARTKDGVCLDQDDDGVCDYAFDLPPRLVITYNEPPDEGGPRPDLGDAPDSDSNHVGINNTAYADGTLGHFPTVHQGTPNNEGAGPRHNNVTLEAILGEVITREGEADTGPDQDNGHNNILDGGADNANNDRGDDGWRNRTATFEHCRPTTLVVRVRKAANAQRNTMYLNAWFDGNHDGDWQDQAPCPPQDGVPSPVANEWIIQDYVVVMTGIPAGGYVDIPINTERVLNTTPNRLHWLRFSLSEIPAPAAPGQLPDGRGPHPNGPIGAYAFGETEDYLVKPAPRGEDGPLVLRKRVINSSGGVVPLGGLVTYEILLKHDGGSQPINARIRDKLAPGLRLLPQIINGQIEYVVASSPTGGVTPLQGQYRVAISPTFPIPIYTVGWNGTLAPNAIVKLSFLVQNLGLCPPNQNTQPIVNIAQARPEGNTSGVIAEATFTAACPGYNPLDIDFAETPIENPIDLDDLTDYPWQGTVLNKHPFTVTMGVYQRPPTSLVDASAALTTSQLLEIITLKPGEQKPLGVTLRLGDENSAVLRDGAELSFCFLPGAVDRCPPVAQYPHLHGHVPITPTIRPSDLGDAPDSTNHAGMPMTAYPGVPANFPTVFDPATGLPQGPRHFHPRAFHLGPRVSHEIEADQGPDQDPLNNIEPAANDPDNDRFDDGAQLRNLNNCQPAAVDVRVAIRPAALAYFQQLDTPAYLNVWIDGNRDGDWADGFTCQDAQGQNHSVVEHILIDYPIDVVGLGVGLHNLPNIATNRVPWPAQLADRPTWVRFTLSDQPSNKPLTFANIQHGDGRGYAQPFKTGETEDYYRYYSGNAVDLAVQLTAKSQRTQQEPGLQAATIDKLGNFEIQMFKVDVANIGATGVVSALLEFQIPEQLRGQQPVVLQAPGVPQRNISFNFDKLSLTLPYIEQDNTYSVVLGWYGCITCTLASNVTAASAEVEYTASATVIATGDTDTSNNQRSTTLRGLLSSPIIGGFMDYTDDACPACLLHGPVVTNRTSLELRGRARPNQIIAILIGLKPVATVNSDANGNFSYNLVEEEGIYYITAAYANQVAAAQTLIHTAREAGSGLATGLLVKIDPSLPYDPMSAAFVDSRGRFYALPTLGYSFGASQAGTWLRSGETYTVSVNASRVNPNLKIALGFADLIISSLHDDDGDGTYVGRATLASNVQAAAVGTTGKLGLLVDNGGSESFFSSDVTLVSDGVISDRSSGQPVANASVVALVEQPVSGGGRIFDLWAQSAAGQPNPQVTGVDGKYSYSASTGIYRLAVTANGYQPYRTGDIDASTTALNPAIALTPAISEAATQQIAITAGGFSPATVTVQPGAVVEFVNLDLAEQSVQGSNADSGLLVTGESYKARFATVGSYVYTDPANPLNSVTIIVTTDTPNPNEGSRLFMPVVVR